MNKLNVLIVDDEKRFTEELSEFLEESGFQAFEANSGTQGMSVLKKQPIDLMVLDVRLPGVNGLDILKDVKVKYPAMEVIIVSAHGDMDTVIDAMRLGAIDYLRKPFRHIDIRIAIERTEKFLLLQRKLKLLERGNSLIPKSLEARIERNFIGVSDEIWNVLDLAMTASKFPDTNVLITGESGTGKENVARIIHFSSDRSDHAFCAINCSAIPDPLLESEFFGYRKGAFTGALDDKKGLFEISDKGTLFLDEIADMPVNLQAKVLRAIEEKKITRIGETHQRSTNFRIISATNRRLEELMDENKFRLDLIHRLNTLHIHIPPLRERPEDIEPLLVYFAEDFAIKCGKPIPYIDKKVIQLLKTYEFPGNVRELKNMTERAIILNKGNYLGIHDFPFKTKIKPFPSDESQNLNLAYHEIEQIKVALHDYNYNKNAAARALGIHRMALSRKMQKYHISIVKKEEEK